MTPKTKTTKPYDKMIESLGLFLSTLSVKEGVSPETGQLVKLFPKRFSKFGDMIVYNETLRPLLHADAYKGLSEDQRERLWKVVATSLGGVRVVVVDHVIGGSQVRAPMSRLLLGASSQAHYLENGIRFTWDVLRVMFSRGNVSEKMRMAQLDCKEEVVVDLFAGIGYFSLTFLVHCKAAFVHACELNPESVRWLRANLAANGVGASRAAVWEGDCDQGAPRGLAHRVSMGLVPHCRPYWRTACECLHGDEGGVLHLHECVSSAEGRTGCLGDWLRLDASLGDCLRLDTSLGDCLRLDTSLGDCLRLDASLGDGLPYGDRLHSGIPPVNVSLDNGLASTIRHDHLSPEGPCPHPTPPGDRLPSINHHDDRYPKDEGTTSPLPPCNRGTVPRQWAAFTREAVATMRRLLMEIYGRPWTVVATHLQHVKSYAPHVDHLVLDLDCRPPPS